MHLQDGVLAAGVAASTPACMFIPPLLMMIVGAGAPDVPEAVACNACNRRDPDSHPIVSLHPAVDRGPGHAGKDSSCCFLAHPDLSTGSHELALVPWPVGSHRDGSRRVSLSFLRLLLLLPLISRLSLHRRDRQLLGHPQQFSHAP